MIFNSLTFGVFFTGLLLLYHFIPSWSAKKNFLLVASFLFYASWHPPFLLLLLFTIIVDWSSGRILYTVDDPTWRKLVLGLSLSSNLGLLAFFKYGSFLTDVINDLLMLTVGVGLLPRQEIILPVGISFYTFQSMSYTIDVYRREIRPAASLRDFALFVSFFPQLVAGPIVRAGDFLPQLQTPRRTSADQTAWGLCLMVVGLFWKSVLADSVFAPIVDRVYGNAQAIGAADAWTGVVAFSGQIYYDFAGYSLCAIGAALCLGFSLPDNFRSPYAALGLVDFWRRWHVSLSTWLRDYVFIPLGGSRGSAYKTFRNLFVTMVIGGIWHGASWMFVVWGAVHGFLLVLERAIRLRFAPRDHTQAITPFVVAGIALTFLVVSLTWIPFRATGIVNAATIVSALFKLETASLLAPTATAACLLIVSITLVTQICCRNASPEEIFLRMRPVARTVGLTCMMLVIYFCSGGNARAFIYFQF